MMYAEEIREIEKALEEIMDYTGLSKEELKRDVLKGWTVEEVAEVMNYTGLTLEEVLEEAEWKEDCK